ncbi:probable cytochrome P450 4d20 [Drosophila pseudoobscura]|uniref:Probable cytochrome P450 4d20 n=1 Tax=Drosophila pseudoobscura pseudoobscura TaxID=46245 RepID=A0A6I8UE68_DROPS|nr:probable cytochrome P450 4d20 [Drosophila pseudoobscura]
MLLLTLAFGALAVLLTWDFVRKRQRAATLERSKISGPLSLPVLGNGLQALDLGAENIVDWVEESFRLYGKTFRMWILGESLIYTKDLKYFEAILGSTTLLQKGQLYKFLRPFLNDGLLLSVGKKWHARRKVFTNAFHFNVLGHYVDIMDRQAAVMVEKLRGVADGETTVDMLPYVSLAALDVITEAAMGVQVNAQSDSEFPYVQALKSVVYIQSDRMFRFLQRYDWLFRLTCPVLRSKLLKDVRVMHDFTDKVIRERRAAVEQAKADGSYRPLSLGDPEVGRKSQMALLDILLQATIEGQPLSDADIREEVDTFMFEGDDTTSSGVSFALYAIARHPQVQARIYRELLQVLGRDPSTPVTQAKLQELKYLDCVIRETLRLYPAVPAVGRYTSKEIQIGGQTIPAHTSIYLVLYFAHREAEFFPDPLAFKPERFLDRADSEDRETFAYLPFSAGPKNCIGQKFAMLEMKALVSKVLRYYELLPRGPEVKPMMNFILRSSSGMNVGLRPRRSS